MNLSDPSVRAALLDIVGLLAVLGSGSVVRVAQASGLMWQHVIPRLMPAPQTFMKDVRPERLPTEKGAVVGVYSGNLRLELNFFAALLHPGKLTNNQVELVEVSKKSAADSPFEKNVYRANEIGPLFWLSLLGLILSALISWLSAHSDDWFALAATMLLSLSSTVVGVASWWKLDLKEKGLRKDREQQIPEGDVVIYYPRLGAFRVVKCNEKISELYFRIESCDYILEEPAYRAAWLCATVLLLSGVICLRKAKPESQIAFAAAYVLLNGLYLICSALNPTEWHWSHDYQVITKSWEPSTSGGPSVGVVMEATMPATMLPTDDVNVEAQNPKALKRRASSFATFLSRRGTAEPDQTLSGPERKYTDALWAAIALVGHSRWVQHARVAPDTGPWKQWIEEAGNIAAAWQIFDEQQQREASEARRESQELLIGVIDTTGTIKLPAWDYQQRLNDLLAAQPRYDKRAPDWPELVKLREAGYFPKTKAEAEPLKLSKAQAANQLPETIAESGGSQGISTGVASTHNESLQPSSSSTNLGVEGTRLRPGAARAQSRESRRPASVAMAELPQTEARNEETVSPGPSPGREARQTESQVARKEKAGV
jgi:hypothetical protein